MLSYLLDTNILSEPLQKMPDKAVVYKLQQHQHDMAFSVLTLYEMQRGANRLAVSKRRTKILQYIGDARSTLPVLSFDERAAVWQANEVVRLTGLGLTLAYVDSQIAAVAAVNSLILVTRNTKDFKHFTGLQLENWFEQK